MSMSIKKVDVLRPAVTVSFTSLNYVMMPIMSAMMAVATSVYLNRVIIVTMVCFPMVRMRPFTALTPNLSNLK